MVDGETRHGIPSRDLQHRRRSGGRGALRSAQYWSESESDDSSLVPNSTSHSRVSRGNRLSQDECPGTPEKAGPSALTMSATKVVALTPCKRKAPDDGWDSKPRLSSRAVLRQSKRKATHEDWPCKRRSTSGEALLATATSRDDFKLTMGIQVEPVPTVDPWASDMGRLVDALSICGAAFLKVPQGKLPTPNFAGWRDLFVEATRRRNDFQRRLAVQRRLLKFHRGEDLSRALKGARKEHKPDVRYNFGVVPEAILSAEAKKDWHDLEWIRDNFKCTYDVLKPMLQQELSTLLCRREQAVQEPKGTLGSKILHNCEKWGGTRLRHSIYPADGSCTEHTDYGVVTLQRSTSAGLEADIHGCWRSLDPPMGCALIYAGDMLERLTNGTVKALRHRVSLKHVEEPFTCGMAVRQANIVFLQPDKSTVVQPLYPYLRGDLTDLPPVRYGEWHLEKQGLAFKWQTANDPFF